MESCVLPSPEEMGRGQRDENAGAKRDIPKEEPPLRPPVHPPRLGIEPRRLLEVALRRVCQGGQAQSFYPSGEISPVSNSYTRKSGNQDFGRFENLDLLAN